MKWNSSTLRRLYPPRGHLRVHPRHRICVGLEEEVGVLEAGKLADLILVTADPLADIRVLQGGQNLAAVVKDGQRVSLSGQGLETEPLELQPATA